VFKLEGVSHLIYDFYTAPFVGCEGVSHYSMTHTPP
jgi:hypothetical protein